MAVASGMKSVFDRSGIPMRVKASPATMVGFGFCSMECCNLKLGVLLLCVLTIWGAAVTGQPVFGQQATTRLEGRVVDADSGEPLEARIYLVTEQNEWLFVQTAHDQDLHGRMLSNGCRCRVRLNVIQQFQHIHFKYNSSQVGMPLKLNAARSICRCGIRLSCLRTQVTVRRCHARFT